MLCIFTCVAFLFNAPENERFSILQTLKIDYFWLMLHIEGGFSADFPKYPPGLSQISESAIMCLLELILVHKEACGYAFCRA